MSISAKKLLSWTSIVLVGLVPLFMLVFMAMPMDHSMGGCPFMQGETSMCPMSIFDHLSSWQSTFTALPLEIPTFIVPVLALAWFWLAVPKPERPPGYRRRFYPATPLLQELFSSGILNPKAP
jgi:hypothetical protein